MGFGILFTGHLLLFFCKGVDIFPDAAAYALMLWACMKLSAYSVGFRQAKLTLYPLTAVAAVSDAFQIVASLGYDAGIASKILMAAASCGMLVMYWFIYSGIREIALGVGRDKIAVRAVRNRYLTVFYTVIAVINGLHPPFLEEASRYLGIFILMIGIVWVILNGMLFYSCYMWICLEGDENMPDKKKKVKKAKGGK